MHFTCNVWVQIISFIRYSSYPFLLLGNKILFSLHHFPYLKEWIFKLLRNFFDKSFSICMFWKYFWLKHRQSFTTFKKQFFQSQSLFKHFVILRKCIKEGFILINKKIQSMDSTHPVLIETDFYSMHSRSKLHYLMILNWEKYLWHLKIVFSYFLRVTQQTIMKIIRIVIWFNRFFTNLRKS